jgi:hypothetical protein
LDVDLFVSLNAPDILADDFKNLDKRLENTSNSGNNRKIDASGT